MQKENQVIELERRCQNLEERLRKANTREAQLENRIISLTNDLQDREELILSKNQIILAEVAASNAMKSSIAKIRNNLEFNRSRIGESERIIMDGVALPELGNFDIRPDSLTRDRSGPRTQAYNTQNEHEQYRTKILAMFREFERLANSP